MSVFSETEPLPDDMAIVQIGLEDWEMGKNFPAEIAMRGDVRETLAALTPVIEAKGGAAHADVARGRLDAVADRNWSALRRQRSEVALARQDTVPIDGDWLMMDICNALPKDAVVVNEGLTTAWNLLHFLPFHDRRNFHSFASGGIGWALPAAVGVQLALPERPVVAIIGDGSAMYSIQALWTAANMKLPITYIIANNQGYRIIKQRLKAFHGNENFIGMDFTDPPIDFVALAGSLGMAAQRISEPAAMRPALEAALASGGPTLLDVVVDRSV
ncbi:MAG: thiamine pyrophosphate-dependent enzyme, partial [Alphaproteobacteria bacterium]|nr:thiamine pyrophosphate-dependent enzyme [Alphaproteobacteria bacterium]